MSPVSKQPKAAKYVIAGLSFATRTALEDHIRGIVLRYEDNVPVNAEDQHFLESLFSRHPEVEEKSGDGIVSIEVRTNRAMYGKTRGFWILREDRTHIDISWKTCVDGSSRSPQKDFYCAARCEIAAQRQQFRDSCFAGKTHLQCPLTGQLITRDNCHIDHVAPKTFRALSNQWLAENHLRAEDIKTAARENGIDDMFCDRALAESWQRFHQAHAVLRVVSKVGNLSLAKIQ